jgi:hypothetical protein
MNKKELDYLLIPDSGGISKKQREKRALQEINSRHIKKVILLTGKDSEEDILFLGKILKKGDRIGIDTFPLHFKEYLEIIKKVKKQKEFPKGIKVENLKTPQTFRQAVYGELGLYEEKILHKKVKLMEYRKENFFQPFKNLVKKVLS